MRISTQMLYDSGTSRMMDRSSDLLKIQNQMATGRRVVTPSDDPIAASSALLVTQAKDINTQFMANQGAAKDALSSMEGKLDSVNDLLIYVKQRAIQSNVGTMTPADRQAIATDIRARFDELTALANSNDALGGYIFAGYQSDTQPFVGTLSSGVSYVGDQGARTLQVSSSRVMPVTNSGSEIFMEIPGVNGEFSTSALNSNTGTATIDGGSVTGSYTGDQYKITFSAPGTYDVVDTTTGASVVSGGSYTSGQPISFAGIQVTISGNPATSDSFSVAPGGSTDIFSTMKNLISGLEGPQGASFDSLLAQSLTRLDASQENVLRVTSSVGSRLNENESLESIGSQANVQYQATYSRLIDLDYAQASSDLMQKSTALEAAQKAFLKTTGLSLFNYIS
ncbi:flagellar hook-associated protein FlgL [Niveibacterium terrae]|uniref:flagellar hook-associated protein FlgL n=1 Tax=Niveibacterium terrae TaxID=3373598 RepID=UPI003A8CC7D8